MLCHRMSGIERKICVCGLCCQTVKLSQMSLTGDLFSVVVPQTRVMTARPTVYLGVRDAGYPLGIVSVSLVLDGVVDATATSANLVVNGCGVVLISTKLGKRLEGHVWQGWRWRHPAGVLPEVHLLLQVRPGRCRPVFTTLQSEVLLLIQKFLLELCVTLITCHRCQRHTLL